MRLLLPAFAALVSGAAWADISAPKTLAFATGECTATVSGTDVGCQRKAVGTVLANGHHMFDFPATDLAIVGFAGTRVDRMDPKKPVLWVERVYLANNQYAADGSCSYETDTASDKDFRTVKCTAILQDGRKISASLNGRADQNPKSMTESAGADTDPEGNPESSCEKLVRLHGLLSRAQFQCGYRRYNSDLIKQAGACGHEIGEALLRKRLENGMHDFDSNEKEKGHARICSELLRVFPKFVRR